MERTGVYVGEELAPPETPKQSPTPGMTAPADVFDSIVGELIKRPR